MYQVSITYRILLFWK